MYRYYITSVVIFLVFSLICGMALAEDHSEKLSVVAVGDNLIHPVVYHDAQHSDGTFNFKPMYSNIKKDIASPDLAFVNQESPLGGDDIPFSGFKRFNTPSQVAGDIVATGFDVINGANNHSLDQGDQGITNHIQTWEKFNHNVLFTGIYNSKKEANRVHTISKNGVKISVLSYTYGTNDMVSNYPYTVKTFDEATIKHDIRKAKKQSDVVMVSAHWGNENHHTPNKTQKKYAQLFANEDVDVVIGTHPHVIQPVKWVKAKNHHHKTLVAYSLGNFLNGQYSGDENNQLLGRIHFDIVKEPKGVHLENVKWTSMVNHYEQARPTNKQTRQHFKIYNLDDYTSQLAQKHGLQYDSDSEWNVKHLQDITKDVIDNKFLNEKSL